MSEPVRWEVISGTASARPAMHAKITDSGSGPWWAVFAPLEWAVAIGMVIGLGVAIYAIWNTDRSGPVTHSLRAADWTCTASHIETTTVYQNMGGKTIMLIPITSSRTVCDKWERR